MRFRQVEGGRFRRSRQKLVGMGIALNMAYIGFLPGSSYVNIPAVFFPQRKDIENNEES